MIFLFGSRLSDSLKFPIYFAWTGKLVDGLKDVLSILTDVDDPNALLLSNVLVCFMVKHCSM